MLKDDHPEKLKVETEETILSSNEAQKADDPLIGSLIAERLEILSLIGAGGMSTVYRAKHLLLDRIVAVKVMQVGKVDDNAVRRFQQEAKAATSLNHPNIATVREFGMAESGDPYLVMDYIEGTSLSDVIKQDGTLSVERTKAIMTQVCAGLQHAHSLGIIHRDLKPANVMLFSDATGNETAKIVDFGIAKIIQNDSQSELTKAGEIFGTPLYMSPEQGLGKTVDARSDIYSLGCMMYECLSGKPPFSAETALETLLQHTTETPPPLNNGGNIAQAVYRCLEKKPENRYQSAEELSRALLNPNKIRPTNTNKAKKLIFIVACAIAFSTVGFATITWPFISRQLYPPHWKALSNAAHENQNVGPGNWQTAKHLYLQAVTEAEKGDASAVEKEQLYKQVGQICNSLRQWDTSIEYLLKALKLNQQHEENGETGSIHDWLSTSYKFQNRLDLAIEHGELAVQLRKKYSPDHPFTLFALLHLGQAYRESDKFAQAEQIDRQSVSLAEKLYPQGDDVNLANACEQLAYALYKQKKFDESIEYYKKALHYSIAARGEKDSQTVKLQDWLDSYMRARRKPGYFSKNSLIYTPKDEI